MGILFLKPIISWNNSKIQLTKLFFTIKNLESKLQIKFPKAYFQSIVRRLRYFVSKFVFFFRFMFVIVQIFGHLIGLSFWPSTPALCVYLFLWTDFCDRNSSNNNSQHDLHFFAKWLNSVLYVFVFVTQVIHCMHGIEHGIEN